MVRKQDTFCLAIGILLVVHVFGQDSAQAVLNQFNDAADHATNHVTLSTPEGNIVIRLRTDVAPQSSAMFSRLVRSGLYNGCAFYRAEDFCIQGGLRMADGRTRVNPFGHFPFEYGLPNKRGTVTLARWQDVNSATGEFFINLKDSPHLDRTSDSGWGLGFAVFGEVESGMDVAERIAKLPTHPQQGLSMLSAPVSFQAMAEAVQGGAPQPVALAAPRVASPVSSFAAASPHLNIQIDQLGSIPVVLDPTNAPRMVAAFQDLARKNIDGKLHRAEGIPSGASQGPPYALVQASLTDPTGILAKLPHEGSLVIGPGSVCVIPGSSDFFISLGSHPGWEASMTIIGQVDQDVVQQMVMPILQRPHHDYKHPTLGTVMSMLDTPLQLHLSLTAGAHVASLPQRQVQVHYDDVQVQAAEASSEEIERESAQMLRGSFQLSL